MNGNMTWNCEQVEERLSEYLDRLLSPAEREGFEAHASACVVCKPLVARVSGIVAEMHAIEPLEAPPRLVRSILEHTSGVREEKKGVRAWLGWLRPVMQPRFAMGVVTLALTLAVLTPVLDIRWSKLGWADLNPVNIYNAVDRKANLVYARSVKFVNGLRVVYEIQSRLQPAVESQPAPEQPKPGKNTTEQQQQEPGEKHNRVVEQNPTLNVLASAFVGLPGRSY